MNSLSNRAATNAPPLRVLVVEDSPRLVKPLDIGKLALLLNACRRNRMYANDTVQAGRERNVS